MYLMSIPVFCPPGVKVVPSAGSVFQGMLMERIGFKAAEKLHEEGMRPYSQSVYTDSKGAVTWRFGILSDNVGRMFAQALCGEPQKIYVRQYHYFITLGTPVIERRISYEELMMHHMCTPVPKKCRIHFNTVTSFKQQGSYVIMPDSRLLYQNLLLRWNRFSPEPLEENIADVLGYYNELSAYQIRSEAFGIEGQRIVGCTGSMTYTLRGSEMVRSTSALLLDFANFSGIGIKTALGMGAVKTVLYT